MEQIFKDITQEKNNMNDTLIIQAIRGLLNKLRRFINSI